MGFTDLSCDSGLAIANFFLQTRSYIVGHNPSQADVTTFKAFKEAPDAGKYPHAARWYKHIASYEPEFATLPGDPSKPVTAYGPDDAEIPVNVKKAPAPAADDEDEMEDLFGSDDDEDEDKELIAQRNKNLAEYRKKAATKNKGPAKSFVTIDVKPWDDETPMNELTEAVEKLLKPKDGLTYGQHKLIPVGFGINKLQVYLTVEDEKISVSDLQEEIEGLEDYVQSTDVAAMQKM
ncbi:hypothetical protein AJ79_06215 [Helicocarpus griseus UAMH5409]|uniref:Elongation factor 1-beta n=1 Tax=Helicocarpus griseus UAMH5409 TaxID=1447875 RepID=A0A2B7XGJ0_9EURO|nr:hypothetical protein AJ79_06215 [Helicocarpus griseus UAMH5409]